MDDGRGGEGEGERREMAHAQLGRDRRGLGVPGERGSALLSRLAWSASEVRRKRELRARRANGRQFEVGGSARGAQIEPDSRCALFLKLLRVFPFFRSP